MSATVWDGSYIGPGPIAVQIRPAEGGPDAEGWMIFLATSRSEGILRLDAPRLAEFLSYHTEEVFVCLERAESAHWRLHDDLSRVADHRALSALWDLSRQSRWIDLALLERLVRYSRADISLNRRDLADLRHHWLNASSSKPRDVNPVAGDRLDRNDLQDALDIFERLRSEIDVIYADADTRLDPEYKVRPMTPDEVEEMRPQNEKFHQFVRTGRIKRDDDSTPGEEEKGAKGCRADAHASARTDRKILDPPPRASAGVGIEVRAAVALARLRQPCDQSGLRIDSAVLPELLARADREYLCACATLARDPEAQSCFAWEGDERIRINMNGFVDGHPDQLAKWLRTESRQLCDALNETAPIPKGPDGRPSLNPEHWGIWPACDRTLWAWRHLVRMAELKRLTRAKGVARPRYETPPALRSLEPNLEVYRKLGVPIFRPREGHVFLAGRVCDLKTRCLAAVGVKRGYVTRGQSRLSNYLLGERRPHLVVARELAEAVARHRPESGKADAERDSRGEYSSIFDINRTGTPLARGRAWLRLTDALLETSPLGLPRSLQTATLRNEYGLGEVTEADVERLMALLAGEVVSDLGPFLEDRTEDIAGARSGLTANAVNENLIRHDHPNTSGAALRNKLKKGRRPRGLTASVRVGEESGGAGTVPVRGRDHYEYRAPTLGGRPTIRASQAAVRQHEVLLAADEVRIEVAYTLISGGFRLLGIAGDEFVVEGPQDRADEMRAELSGRASEATALVLGEPPASVVVEIKDRW